MKDIKNKKILSLAVIIIAVILGGFIIFQDKDEKSPNDTTTSTTKDSGSVKVDDSTKQDIGNPSTTATSTTKGSQTIAPQTPSDYSSLASLQTSLTATKQSEDVISLAFYMESGSYTIQEKTDGVWKNTTENIFYPGSGGLVGGELKAGETTKTIRILKIENGKYTKISKDFIVSRADIISAGGIKTYN